MTRSGPALTLPSDSPLHTVAAQSPALVIFLRSFGCTFCREAMADVSRLQQDIRHAGAGIVFVHSASAEEAAPWFARYGLSDVTTISDPERRHYQAFGLGRTAAASMVDPRVWMRGAASAMAHGFGPQSYEMMRQLPGVFVVQNGSVLAEYRHQSPSDRPDYLGLIRSTM
jgi:hypothetical protein